MYVNTSLIIVRPFFQPWFRRLIDIENGFSRGRRIFRTKSGLAGLLGGLGNSIDDDHKPFEQRGVPIIHVIASPFPKVWHTLGDNANAINRSTVEKLNMIFRNFVAEYLGLP